MATKKPAPPLLASDIVDEIGDLEGELKPYTPKIARLDALRKQARVAYDASDPSVSFDASGARYVLQLGPRAMRQGVNVSALAKAITYKNFVACASVTLASVRLHCSSIAEAFISSDQTGPRSLKILEKGGA